MNGPNTTARLRATVTALGGVGLLVASPVVFAHSQLVEPPPRTAEDYLMDGPCGGVVSTTESTTFVAGENVVIRWSVAQNHSAQFRVAFSPSGDVGFDDWVLGVRPDISGEVEYEQELALPECVCDDCALQLLQYSSPTMLAGYYSCADIELTQPEGGSLPACEAMSGDDGGLPQDDTGDEPATSADGGDQDGGATTGAATPGGATEGDAPAQSKQDDGGCSLGNPTRGSFGWSFGYLAFALVCLRRRRISEPRA
ncbi:MAG: hypothetical protein JKY37_21785 [Nannocystaceae bacterium]|nr:hypothetical protein [Nannocystaceae bacterium]